MYKTRPENIRNRPTTNNSTELSLNELYDLNYQQLLYEAQGSRKEYSYLNLELNLERAYNNFKLRNLTHPYLLKVQHSSKGIQSTFVHCSN